MNLRYITILMIFNCTMSAWAASVLPQQNDLIAYWSFDTNFEDQSGNGLHATGNGDAHIADGKFGNAASFDGHGDYLIYNASPLLNIGTGPVTVAAWINMSPDWAESSGWGVFEAMGNGNNNIYLKIQNAAYSKPRSVSFTVRESNQNQNHHFGNAYLHTGRWYHVVGVRDGNTTQIYVDGLLDSTHIEGNNVDVTPMVPGDQVRAIGANSAYSRLAHGLIDELAVWNAALNSDQVQSLYENTPAVPAPLAVVGGLGLVVLGMKQRMR